MPSPLISVVIPVYNGATTLAGCLEAVLASDYTAHEIVVVDDGSTDDSRAIASQYSVQIVALEQNLGAARAKNQGVSAAKGSIIFFTDADVHIPPQALSYVAEDMADEKVHAVVGLLADSCPYRNFASQFKNLWMHFTYRRQPERVGLFFTSAAAIRREIFVREGGFDPNYAGASITEDIEFGQRLLAKDYWTLMDQRITVEHHKHYTWQQVLCTDLYRARGLLQTWLRNRANKSERAHYASVPWYFGAGVGALGLAIGLGLLALLFGSGTLGVMCGLGVTVALALNVPFLVALARWRGPLFGLQSAGFLLADLFVSGLGILLGGLDFLRGKSY